jgi:DNA-binding transcriptional LysR family regulator
VLEFVATPLINAFTERPGRAIEASAGGAVTGEMPVLLANRFADVALGPDLGIRRDDSDVVSEPIFRTHLVVVTGGTARPPGAPGRWFWLADSSATDPASDCGKLLHRLRVPDSRIRVFSSQTAAWAAATDGQGVAIAPAHLIAARLRRGELQVVHTAVTPADSSWYLTTLTPERRSIAAESFRHFLSTAAALRVMREPGAGVPPSRFKPPVYVTLWS